MTDYMLLRILAFILVPILYLGPVVILIRYMRNIEEMIKRLAKSPKDVSDIFAKVSAGVIVYFVLVGVVVLTLVQGEIKGVMSYVLFAVVGWVFGLFGPRPYKRNSEEDE